MTKLAGPVWLLVTLGAIVSSPPRIHARATAADTLTLRVPQTVRMTLDLYHNYTITVTTSSVPSNDMYSSFLIQVHSQLYPVSLMNDSIYCQTTRDAECTAVGSNVGLVQVWNQTVTVFPFRVMVECSPTEECSSNSSVGLLIAVTGIATEAPIPGGCALTSNLFIDPNLAISYTSYSTEVRFQDSDVGFRPENHTYPTCDSPISRNNSDYPLQYLEYTLHQRCLGSRQFGVDAMMDAIQDMISVTLTEEQESSYSTLQYNDPKKITFSSIPGQGVVYNVIATDKRTGAKMTYVPAITYACDIHAQGTQSCRGDIPVINGIIGVILLVLGLVLCLVGHIFFHGEVIVFQCIGGYFLWFMLLSITTSLDGDLLVGLSLLFGVLYGLVWFLFWFLTGWHWFQVLTFGLYADFLITASILYSPIEDISVFTVLQISYVYYLTVICGLILFMVPIVAFPRALSIWTSSLVGSYTFIFGIGMFTYTELSEIVLLVVKKFSIPGFYTAHINCPPMTSDYILVSVWMLLLVTGLIIQTTVVQRRRTKHNRRQRMIANGHKNAKFSSFPRPSLLKQLLRYRKKKSTPEGEPLLTPSKLDSGHCPWSTAHRARLPSDGQRSPEVYPSSYGAIGTTNGHFS